jgi:hypothetical protein
MMTHYNAMRCNKLETHTHDIIDINGKNVIVYNYIFYNFINLLIFSHYFLTY